MRPIITTPTETAKPYAAATFGAGFAFAYGFYYYPWRTYTPGADTTERRR